MTVGRPDLPVGTVTFMRTDIEGSMTLARALGARWDPLNETHLELIRHAVARHGGTVVRTEGDALFAAFAEAGAAAAAAVEAQRALQGHPWPDDARIRVRMGLHSGEAHHAGADYGGFDVNRGARIAAAGHGGQIVVSEPTAVLIADQLPPDSRLDDLGAHQLRDVPRPERLHQLTALDLPAAFPPLRTAGGAVGNLPERLTSLVGRDAEIAAIVDLARSARLITLTGPGGIGKSSLAVEVARQLGVDHPDGAWFVALADVTDAADVGGAIAHGVGLLDGPERPASTAFLSYLAERSVVIVLDNFEQLMAATGQVAALVRASPGSRIIVTSRAPLHLAGEREVPVPPLSRASTDLFIERARAVRPDWTPGPDLSVVEDICALLDHLPLGIELAAARIGLLPPLVLRDRLADRLPLPGQGLRDAPTRQQTLDSVVAWSHDQLEPDRQRLLQELAVFDGGFDLEQVEAISADRIGDRLDDLLQLADRSLIEPVADPGGRPRFRMLRTIQSFALTKLGSDEADVRRRHATAYLQLLRSRLTGLHTSEHSRILDRIGPDVANVRAAQRWAIEAGEAELALELASVLWRFWNAFGLGAEGRRLTVAALTMPGADVPTPARAWAASAAGSLAYWQADTADARAWYDEQLALARVVDDETCIVDALFNLGHVSFIDREDEAVQIAYMEAVVARYRDLGDVRGLARAGWSRAILALRNGRPAEGAGYLRAAVVEFERLDDRQYLAMSVASLGWAAFVMGDTATATRESIRGLIESHTMRDLGTTTISLHVGVLVATLAERWEAAAELAGAFEAACERYGVRPPAALDRFMLANDPIAATRMHLPSDVFDAAYERGTRLSLDEAVAKVASIGEGLSTPEDPTAPRA